MKGVDAAIRGAASDRSVQRRVTADGPGVWFGAPVGRAASPADCRRLRSFLDLGTVEPLLRRGATLELDGRAEPSSLVAASEMLM